MENCTPVVTTNQDINYATIGRPFLLTPQDFKTNGFRLTAGATDFVVSFKAPDDHIFVDRVCLTVWEIDGGNNLTQVDPDAIVGNSADIRIRIKDNNYLREMSNREYRWNQIAGNAGQPAHWPGAKWIHPSGIINVTFTNNQVGQDYIIGMTLVCRRVAADQIGDNIRKDVNPGKLKREFERTHTPLTQDANFNVRHKGIPRCLSPTEDNALPSAFAAATWVAPSPAQPRAFVVLTEPSFKFIVKNFVGTQRVNGANTIIANNPDEAIFVQAFSRKYNQWLTDGFVPFGHLFGDGNFPGYLPVEWVIDENDAIILEMQSYSQNALDINFGVWGTYRTSPRYAQGVYA